MNEHAWGYALFYFAYHSYSFRIKMELLLDFMKIVAI